MNNMVLLGMLIYIAAMLAVGYWSSKRVKNLADFLVAGRRLPFYLAVTTLIATWFGAGSCMGASGTAYSMGLLGVVSDPFAAGLSLILAGFFYVGFLRRLKLLTVTDIFGKYYSRGSEIFASFLMIPVYIGWLGSQMVALGYILNVLTGADPTVGIIAGGIIVLVYTYAGGMWAVTLTDFIQVTILVVGLFTILPSALSHVGGLNVLIDSTPREFLRIIPSNPGYNDWIAYIGQWTLMGLGCIVGQDLIQRSLASRNESIAKRSAVTAGVCYILMGTIPILLGFAGRLIIPGLQDPELIMPNLAIKFLPPFMLVMFLSALVSAIMSSADSSLLAASSLMSNSIILPLFPKIGRKQALPLARITTVIMAVISMAVALCIKQIYHLMVNSWATLFVGIFVPVTAALYWKKANNLAAWVSMIAGTGTWLGYIMINTGTFFKISDPLFYRAAAYGGLVSFLSYVIVTFAIYKKIKPIKLASEYAAQ